MKEEGRGKGMSMRNGIKWFCSVWHYMAYYNIRRVKSVYIATYQRIGGMECSKSLGQHQQWAKFIHVPSRPVQKCYSYYNSSMQDIAQAYGGGPVHYRVEENTCISRHQSIPSHLWGGGGEDELSQWSLPVDMSHFHTKHHLCADCTKVLPSHQL